MVDNYQVPAGMDASQETQLNIVSFSRELGLDIIERYEEARWEKAAEVRRYEKPLVKEIHRDVDYRVRVEGDKIHRSWDTPHGLITTTLQSVRYNTGLGTDVATEFPIEYPIKRIEDFKAFAFIFEDLIYEIDEDAVLLLDGRIHEVGNDGITLIWAPSSPLGMAHRYHLGVEFLCIAYHDYNSKLRELFEIIGAKYLEKQRLLAQLNADGTNNADDSTTRAFSPKMFKELELDYINKAARVNHEHGKLYVHHSCGHIHHLLDLYAQTDMDAVDMLTIRPTGDCELPDARRRLGRNITIMAPFDIITMNGGDMNEIRAMVRRFYEEGNPGDNLIPLLVPQPNVSTLGSLQMVVEEARKYQHMVG
jgi:hypothetical protein